MHNFNCILLFRALNGYSNPMMASIGRDLRKISEQFANSSQRENVRKKAEKVMMVIIDD